MTPAEHSRPVLACAKRNIILRPAQLADHQVLLKWRNDPDTLTRYSMRRSSATPEQFMAEENNTHLRYMIIRDGKVVGTMMSYSYNPHHGWVYVGVIIAPEHRGIGIAPIAFALLVRHLFATFQEIRKVYSEAYSFNRGSVGMLEKSGMILEATLLEHVYWNNSHHNLLVYSMGRDSLGYATSIDLLARLGCMS